MTKSEQAQKLLSRLEGVTKNYQEAQGEMLAARAVAEQFEREYKEAKVAGLALSDGKNAEKREFDANGSIQVRDAKAAWVDAQTRFNRAYREYKIAESDLLYIRDATALLREMD